MMKCGYCSRNMTPVISSTNEILRYECFCGGKFDGYFFHHPHSPALIPTPGKSSIYKLNKFTGEWEKCE